MRDAAGLDDAMHTPRGRWRPSRLAGGRRSGPVINQSTFHAASVLRMHETAILSVKPGSAPPATILIVDDEPEVRTVVAEFLEDFGYHVLQANGGPQALGRLHDD